MVRTRLLSISVLALSCTLGSAHAQTPPVSDTGWVVIPVDDYRALRLRAYPPDRPADPPPVDATVTRVEYDLRVNGESASGEARLTVDVLKQGWVTVNTPAGLLVRGARVDGRVVPLIDGGAPHVLLSRPGRALLSLDVVVPVRPIAGVETLTLPASQAAVARVSLAVPRQGIDVTVTGGVLAERPADAQGSWIAFGRPGQPLAVSWKRRIDDVRATQALKWRGSITQLIGLGEETSPISAAVVVDVVQGVARAVDVALPDGVTVNDVSGPLVADWEARPGTLRVNFLEPVPLRTAFSIGGEARTPRDGTFAIPLVRLAAADRETGGVAVEVLGAGEISTRDPRGLEPADVSDLGEPITGRESPSMQAYRFRAQGGQAPRSLTLSIARYTPQAVLVANVEEARYDALVDEQGKTLVRARYAVRNNQRAFLGATLPDGATLWTAAVNDRPLRPGTAPDGSLLLPLEKGRAGGDTPVFVVELTYVQRAPAWNDKGEARLTLPAIDLPIARTGIKLHHSPRFKIDPEPGAFRVEAEVPPFHEAFNRGTPPPAPRALEELSVDSLVAKSRVDGGRTLAGPLPVRLPFPSFGPCVFLMTELTTELQKPSVAFTYKREQRW
jgi:hypothetical protein